MLNKKYKIIGKSGCHILCLFEKGSFFACGIMCRKNSMQLGNLFRYHLDLVCQPTKRRVILFTLLLEIIAPLLIAFFAFFLRDVITPVFTISLPLIPALVVPNKYAYDRQLNK